MKSPRFLCVALLLLLHLFACGGGPPDLERLAPEVLRRTPEHTHFVDGTTFDWVVLEVEPGDAPPELISAVTALLAKKYQLYASPEEIPTEYVHERRLPDGTTEFGGYRNGFLFRFSLRVIEADLIEVAYSDYESPLAASSGTIVYRWNGRAWAVVSEGPMVVS